ncbi:hypothetical protein ACFPRL_12625 [Pseudoclavibacter helvolus]
MGRIVGLRPGKLALPERAGGDAGPDGIAAARRPTSLHRQRASSPAPQNRDEESCQTRTSPTRTVFTRPHWSRTPKS